MTIPVFKAAMNAGEITPEMYGRTDIAKYAHGASTLRNMYASIRGGAVSRAGLLFCGICKQGWPGVGTAPPPRNITYQYSANQGIVIEAGDHYFRFLTDGGYITETPVGITGITNANPGVFTAANSYAPGDWVFLTDITVPLGNPLNNQIYVIGTATGTQFTLLSTLTSAPISTIGLGAYAGGGIAGRLVTIATPYADADVGWLKVAQSADVMSLTCVNQITNTEYPPYDLARISDTDWQLTKTAFNASIGPPASIAVSQTNAGGTASFYYQFVVTAVDAKTGEESIASPVGTVLTVDQSVTAGSIYIASAPVAGAGSYNFYGAPESYSVVPSGGQFFGYVGSSFGPTFTDTNVEPDYSVGPPLHLDPFATSSILAVTVTSPGSAYDTASATAYVNSPIGRNAALLPVINAGSVAWVIVQSGGAGYTGGETVYFTGATPSATQAKGSIGFSVNPANNDTITLNGQIWKFVSTGATSSQTIIQANTQSTLSVLAAQLNGSTSSLLDVAAYGVSSYGTASATGSLLITYIAAGTAGNAYTLAASAATPSGPTLTGGTSGGGGGGAAATLDVGPATGTYPGLVSYFQQRRFYAASLNDPDTYWASQPGAFVNMDISNPIVDSDAITGSPWSQQVNGIQWMLNMPGGLVVLTGLGAWQLSGAGTGLATSAAITPANQVAVPQAFNGCSPNVQPIPINYDVLYVQEKGSIVRDLSYNFFVNIYTGTDLTVLSNHLFNGHTILQWGWAEEKDKLLWVIRDDGILLCLTYLKEQDVYAWSRHDTNGLFQSVCTVSEPPVNAPYFVVQRLIQNHGNPITVYTQERMDNRLWTTQTKTWCVDCGTATAPMYPDAVLSITSANGVPTLQQPVIVAPGSGYSAGTTASVVGTSGAGATASVTVVGGVITAASVGGTLTGYVAPVFVVFDPLGTGSGANITIANPAVATLFATPGVFANGPSQGQPGDVIRMGLREIVVLDYVSATEVIGNVTQNNQPGYPDDPYDTALSANPGGWSITDPFTIIYGLNYLEGMTVSILADGVVQPLQTVQNGTVTLANPASYAVVGLGFNAQLQTLYLDVPGGPTVQGRWKEFDTVVIRVNNTGVPFGIGANQPDAATQPGFLTVPWSNMLSVDPATGAATGSGQPLASNSFNTDDIRVAIFDEPGVSGGQVAVQQDNPVPLEILALVPWVRMQDDID